MKLTIDIPREYERDFSAGKFKDFFSRVIADIDFKGICGNYEKEIAEMFLEAFDKAIVGNANLNSPVKLYKKQIRPIAEGCAWQGFNPDLTPLSDWIDIEDSEEQIENQLKEKWTDEEMFKITHDKMRCLSFKYRFVEVES
jgi:hypothetical protein